MNTGRRRTDASDSLMSFCDRLMSPIGIVPSRLGLASHPRLDLEGLDIRRNPAHDTAQGIDMTSASNVVIAKGTAETREEYLVAIAIRNCNTH